MAIASDAGLRDQLFIGGEWVEPAGDGTIDVINPTTEEVVGRVPVGTAEDADRAVAAARAAFDSWSQRHALRARSDAAPRSAPSCRAGRRDRRPDHAREMGMPIGLSRMIQAGLPAVTFASMAELVEQIEWEEQVGNSLILPRAGRRRRRPSPRGTTRSTRSRTRSRRRSPRAARWS